MAGWMAERARRLLAKPGRRSESPRHRGRHAATPAGGKASASSPPSGTGTGDRPAPCEAKGSPGGLERRRSDPLTGPRRVGETLLKQHGGKKLGLVRGSGEGGERAGGSGSGEGQDAVAAGSPTPALLTHCAGRGCRPRPMTDQVEERTTNQGRCCGKSFREGEKPP